MSIAPVAVHSSAFDASETNELPLDVLESRMLLASYNSYNTGINNNNSEDNAVFMVQPLRMFAQFI